ncbi:hypothetical protein [Salinibacterium sp. ZJ454]|uniref:hypothetical protein n=1 Tax=Salinibacterium sp. ZJ454 TaxID=2708339 RepID=UPI0014224579|nr:hypothetical protein [Salinibacterium sp. ZJ454]
MNQRQRIAWLAGVSVVVLAAATFYGVTQWQLTEQARSAPSAVEVAAEATVTGPRVVFRNTASGEGYGHVASVPLENPGGERAISPLVCDRVDATSVITACLRVLRGVLTTYEAQLYDAENRLEQAWPLAGIPSRTRLSGDSELVATTAFVTGHSYATVGFSTETVVTDAAGHSLGNLEEFELLVDGQPVLAADRNIWGVTFTDDGRTFYATAASGGRTWLVEGDLDRRTLTAIRDGAECPSLSPDGSRLAYKKNVGSDGQVRWTIAVYELSTGQETTLPIDQNVDDQVEWLDDATLLFGLARTDSIGDSDVWAVAVDGSAPPAVFIEHAWSPAVVHKVAG